jgi:hypothetical protein
VRQHAFVWGSSPAVNEPSEELLQLMLEWHSIDIHLYLIHTRHIPAYSSETFHFNELCLHGMGCRQRRSLCSPSAERALKVRLTAYAKSS